MRTTKKAAALLLAIVMMLAMSVTAAAAGSNKITVNNAEAGETYSVFKMLDLEVDDAEDPTAFSYKVSAAWADFFKAAEGTEGE